MARNSLLDRFYYVGLVTIFCRVLTAARCFVVWLVSDLEIFMHIHTTFSCRCHSPTIHTKSRTSSSSRSHILRSATSVLLLLLAWNDIPAFIRSSGRSLNDFRHSLSEKPFFCRELQYDVAARASATSFYLLIVRSEVYLYYHHYYYYYYHHHSSRFQDLSELVNSQVGLQASCAKKFVFVLVF